MNDSQTTIRRAPRPEGVEYVECDDGPYNDPRLSWGARGLIQYLLSQPYGWTAELKHLEGAASGFEGGPNDDRAIRTMLRELMLAGYVRRELTQPSEATTPVVEYQISEVPCEVDLAEADVAVAKMLKPGGKAGRPSEILRRLD